MNSKSRAVLIIMACLVVVTKPDQGLDCRKLVFSRNCRGVAIKRGHIGNSDARSGGLLLERLGYRGMLNGLKSETEAPSLDEKTSPQKSKIQESIESDLSDDKLHLDNFLYSLFTDNKKKINENDNFPMYEYYNF